MSHRELRLNSRRLLIATVIAVAIHAGLFFLIPLVMRLERSRKPEYGGTVLVHLEEPAPAQVGAEGAVVVPAPEPPPVVKPAPPPKPVPAPKPAPAPRVQPATRTAAAVKAPVQAPPVVPAQPAPPQPAPGPAFKEAGGKTGVAQPLAAPEPLGTVMAAQAVAGPEPTLPGAGTPSGAAAASPSVQSSGVAVAVPAPPTRGAGAAAAQGGTAGSTLDLGTLDKALAGTAKAGATATRADADAAADARDFSVVWEEPDAGRGRDLLSAPRPKLPKWVADQGLALSVPVSFAVAPDGVVARARVERTSGYSDVDAAVLEAVRRWRFRAAETTSTVRGSIHYTIRAR